MRTARPETIRGFYERHYQADALAVIVVGAVPDAVQVDQLDRAFAPYFRKGAARPWPRAPAAFFPDPSSFGAAVFAEAPRRRVRASVFEDAEATSAFAAISVAKRYEAATTVGGFRRWLVGDVAQNVVNRQLAKLAMASAPPFSSASVGAQPPVALRRVADGIQGVTVSMLSAVPLAHDRVADALRSAWRVVAEKRDRVTADELRMARREILGDLQTQWKERDQTESSSLADEARDHFLLAAPYVDDRDEVALAAALLQTVTVEDVRNGVEINHALRRWRGGRRRRRTFDFCTGPRGDRGHVPRGEPRRRRRGDAARAGLPVALAGALSARGGARGRAPDSTRRRGGRRRRGDRGLRRRRVLRAAHWRALAR